MSELRSPNNEGGCSCVEHKNKEAIYEQGFLDGYLACIAESAGGCMWCNERLKRANDRNISEIQRGRIQALAGKNARARVIS